MQQIAADQPRLINPPMAAKFLGVAPNTLAKWRCNKRYGLPYIKKGRHVVYDMRDLLQWLESRKVR